MKAGTRRCRGCGRKITQVNQPLVAFDPPVAIGCIACSGVSGGFPVREEEE